MLEFGMNPLTYIFYRNFCSVIRKKEFDISQGVFSIYPAFLENRIFLPYFALLPVFTKSATGRKRAVIDKNVCDFKTAYAQMFFLRFEAKSQFYFENKKKFEKK